MKVKNFVGFVMAVIMLFSSITFGEIDTVLVSASDDLGVELTTEIINENITEITTENPTEKITEMTTEIIEIENGVAKYPAQGGYIYVDMSTGEVTDCDETVESVVIPSEINGIKIIRIGDSAFRECSRLTGITIPEGVTRIGNSAFYGCSNLISITIPVSVTSIGTYAFYGCSSLISITIPVSVTRIGGDIFRGCSSLKTAGPIGGGYDYEFGWTESIPNYAFYGCSSLTSITIPESVTSIGAHAFWGCIGLTSITIPKGVTSIGDSAFDGCSGLTSINVAEENNEYASFDGVLYNKNKTDIIYCPKGKTSVMIFEGATSICDYVFYNCGSLTSITIPEGVTSIGSYAFYGCSSLTSITIPEGVTSIGNSVFRYCSSLTSITIPESVTSIGDYAFWGCSLTSITIPESVTSIGDYAFWGCSNLTSITIPESVTSIGDSVFRYCSSLTSITIPESVTSIGNEAFFYCIGLTSITIPEGVTSIGNSAFMYCNSIISITIPEGVTSIGNSAFSCCSSITSITIPESVTSIGSSAFFYCDSLETVYCYEGSAADDASLYPEGVTIVYISDHGSTGVGIIIDPTCTEDGLYYESCKYPGCEEHFNEKVIPALGHDYSSEYTVDKEPTCESTGLKSRHCTRCGSAADYTEIEKLPHTFGDYVIVEEATYFKQGVKSRTCSVCGLVEKEIIPTLDYDYENDYNYGMVTFNVVNAVSSEAVEGAQITINSNNGNTYIVNTDAEGSASQIVPVGLCSISVYKNNMIMRKFEWTITAGLNEIPDIGLSSEPLIEGSVNTTVLTKTEIEDLGIDTSAPENNHIVKFEVQIDFGGYSSSSDIGAVGDLISNIITITRYENEKGEEVQPSKGEKGGSSGISIPGGGMAYFPSSNFILIVYGEAKWLKEMFDVELILLNNSATDTATECMAEINLPEGLSLADMVEGSQSAVADMGTIPSGGLKRTHWYVRGDSAGSYNITASVNGIFRPLGDAFSYNYTTAEPVNVYAGSAMNMKITVPEACEFNEPYEFSVALTNVSDRSLYNLEYKVTDIAQYEKTGYTSYDFETSDVECKLDNKEISWNGIGDDGKISVEELKPGETITINLSTKVLYKSLLEKFQERCKKYEKLFDAIPEGDSISYVIKLISCIDARYFLSDVVVTTMEGSTTSIPWEVETVPVEGNRTVRRILDTLSDELKSSLIGDMKDVFVDIIDIESGADGDITAIYENMKSIVDIIEAAGGLLTYEIITPTDAEVRVWVERTYDTEAVSDENSANTFSLMSLDNSLSQDYGYFTIKSDSPDAYVEDGKMVLKGRQFIEVTASGGDQGTLYVEYADGTIDSFKIATEEEPDFYTSAEQFEFDESNGTINRYSGTDSQVIIPKEINGVEVKEIGYGAFANNNTLESVVISNSVISISGSAFSGCENLNSVIMADTVSYIGSYAFKGCSQLKSIELPSLTEYISDYAFEGSGISKLVIPQGVKSLGYYTFANCDSLTEITVPKSVEFINKNCFINCNNIEKVYCYINSMADNADLYANDSVMKYIGDVNDDTTVDNEDAAIMLKNVYDSDKNEVPVLIWDYNNDGAIDILDVVGVLQDI